MSISRLGAAVLAAALAVSACKESDDEPTRRTVQGVVTSAEGELLEGVRVSLQSSDRLPPTTTDANGFYRFDGVAETQNLIVQFQAQGYLAKSITVSVQPPPPGGSETLVVDVSVTLDVLTPAVSPRDVPVAGYVYAGPAPANEARVMLTDADGDVLYEAATGVDGRFSFPGVRQDEYTLVVAAFDANGDTISDYQYFRRALDVSMASSENFSNVVVVLEDSNHDLRATSFVSLSVPMPLAPAQLLVPGAVSGMLQSRERLWLHFGAEVDPALTEFELVKIEANGARTGSPIALDAAWTNGVIATITPVAPLEPSASLVGPVYELRIRSLVFRDGTIAIRPPGQVGAIRFTVQAVPDRPEASQNPIPALALDGQAAGDRAAVTAVVDAAAIRLLDANGDLVAIWGAGPSMRLTWQHVPGSVRYQVWARNTTSLGGDRAFDLQWRPLASAIGPFDPNENTTILATGIDPWAAGLGYVPPSGARAPWAFGNGVEFAVTTENVFGFQSAIEPTRVLATSDTYGGRVAGAVELAGTAERGDAFEKRVRVTFSEPMLTVDTARPAIAPVSAALTFAAPATVTFGNGGAAQVPPPNAAFEAYFDVSASVRGPCTELLAARAAGDAAIPVRDPGRFSVGAAERVLVVNPATGAAVTELTGVTSVDGATGVLRIASPFTVGAPAGSLVCAVGHPEVVPVASVAAGNVEVGVTGGGHLFVGETVLVHEPGVASDVRTIQELDTTSGLVRFTAALTAGHTSAARIVPLVTLGGEYALRAASLVGLAGDVFGAGATAPTEVRVAGPSSLREGDLVLFDADGDLATSVDRFEGRVTELRFAPPTGSTTYAFEVQGVPAGAVFLRGIAAVIATGDAFEVTGSVDTSVGGATRALDAEGRRFTTGGFVF